MRYLSIVLMLSVFPSVFFADPVNSRPLDPIAAEAFANALERSAAVRQLIEKLEASNVIIHILSSRDLPAGIGGTTQFVATSGGYRYLRITIGSTLPLKLRSAILGHELRHASEIADSGAADAESVRELFEQAGQREGDFFETRAAMETERIVRRELRSERRAALEAEPVVKFHH